MDSKEGVPFIVKRLLPLQNICNQLEFQEYRLFAHVIGPIESSLMLNLRKGDLTIGKMDSTSDIWSSLRFWEKDNFGESPHIRQPIFLIILCVLHRQLHALYVIEKLLALGFIIDEEKISFSSEVAISSLIAYSQFSLNNEPSFFRTHIQAVTFFKF